MTKPEENKSEVGRLLEQISLEYEAAHRITHDFAAGAGKHQFIAARMENMGRLHSKLQKIVGDSAIAMVADKLSELP
jgi:hypothetical protein